MGQCLINILLSCAGPGAYEVARPVATGPAFSLKGRPKPPSALPDDLPGPGEYDVPTKV